MRPSESAFFWRSFVSSTFRSSRGESDRISARVPADFPLRRGYFSSFSDTPAKLWKTRACRGQDALAVVLASDSLGLP